MEGGKEGRRRCIVMSQLAKQSVYWQTSVKNPSAHSSLSHRSLTSLRRPLTSHFAVRDGFPSYLGRNFFFFLFGGGGASVAGLGGGKCLCCRPLCRVICIQDGMFFFFFLPVSAKAKQERQATGGFRRLINLT